MKFLVRAIRNQPDSIGIVSKTGKAIGFTGEYFLLSGKLLHDTFLDDDGDDWCAFEPREVGEAICYLTEYGIEEITSMGQEPRRASFEDLKRALPGVQERRAR